MQNNLSQKERMFLEEAKAQEELCIQKYSTYSQQALDPELKQILSTIASDENEHYNTINQILVGKNQSGQNQAQNQAINLNDKMICMDLLSTEKFVSSNYDLTVFECVDPQIRQQIQHIQQEEQNHGETLFNYMNSHGMYPVK